MFNNKSKDTSINRCNIYFMILNRLTYFWEPYQQKILCVNISFEKTQPIFHLG